MVHCPHKFAESSDLHISLFPGEDLILQTADWWVLGPQPELLKKVIYQPPFPWFQSETVLRNPSTNCKSISIIVHHHYIAKYQWRNIKASQKWRQKSPKISGLPDCRTPARACLELPGPSFQGTHFNSSCGLKVDFCTENHRTWRILQIWGCGYHKYMDATCTIWYVQFMLLSNWG